MARPLPLLLLLVAACDPEWLGSDDTGDVDPCDPAVPADQVDALPMTATWESAERSYATGLGWGDFDDDGHRDLVVASGNDMEPGRVSVHRGPDLDPTPASSGGVAYHGHLAVGDVDHDGYDDVVVARYLGVDGFGSPGGVDWYRGGPEGLAKDPAWSADGFHTFAVALGDPDGDGDLDLAVAVGEVYEGDPEPSRLYENDGDGFGADPAWTSDPAYALDVAFVDADGDRDLDLVFARHGAPHARFDNDGGFPSEPSWEASGAGFDGNSLDFGDVDGDGLPDLLVTDTDPGTARLYCGPSWALCWERPGTPVMASAASLVDVDGDRDLDAVVGAWWGQIEVWPNDDGALEDRTSWRSIHTAVIEAFAWHDRDGSDEQIGCSNGDGLVEVPRGAWVTGVSTDAAAVGDGYVTAPTGTALHVTWRRSRAPDLALSDWDPEHGSVLLERGVSTFP